jgi:hypothetical protein
MVEIHGVCGLLHAAEPRGNQITLKFQNVLLAEKNTIMASRIHAPDA